MPTENVAAGGKTVLIFCRRSGVAFREGEINLYPDIKLIEVRTVRVKKKGDSLEIPNLNNFASYGGRGTFICIMLRPNVYRKRICIISAAIQSFLLLKLKTVILTHEYLPLFIYFASVYYMIM
jgi:hypothetical protein